MKINGEFVLREVMGEYLLVPVGELALKFNGMIITTETGAIVWRALAEGREPEDAIRQILDEYEIDEATARTDVEALIAKLKEADIISE